MAEQRVSLMWLFASIVIIGILAFVPLVSVQGTLGNLAVAIIVLGVGVGYYYVGWEMD